jgi:hypothetical protein
MTWAASFGSAIAKDKRDQLGALGLVMNTMGRYTEVIRTQSNATRCVRARREWRVFASAIECAVANVPPVV